MVMMILREDVASGMWKFDDTVDVFDLERLAESWRESKEDGGNYLDLHVRQCSKNQMGIGFQYVKADGSEATHKKFFHKMTDQLKRRFGNGFVGWDISSRTYVIAPPRVD